MRRDELTGMFAALETRGIFVCSSRFDVVPYTALEALRSGLMTVAPRSSFVGVAEYLPAKYCYEASPEGLGTLLKEHARTRNSGDSDFVELVRSVRHLTSDESFVGKFLVAFEIARGTTRTA
jgi:hypothetical protein